MFQKFVANNLNIDNVKRSITVNFSLDVDEDTINTQSLYVTKARDNKIIRCKYKVNGDTVTLIFDTDFEVNETYTLYATYRILSVTGEKLATETVRNFSIGSNVDSSCKIIAPANHEDIKTVRFEWEEIPGKSGILANSFYLEVAPDVQFFRPILQTEVKNQTFFEAKTLEPARQYFVRVRSQADTENYGNWAEKVTFTYTAPIQEQDDGDDIIYVKPLEILSRPDDGITPKRSFVFEFDKDIDSASLETGIRLFRRDL